MAPHSSTLAWKIPWMEEPGRLQSMGLLRVGHNWRLHFHFSLSCIGEGNGNPLQRSCLENPREGGAWWAAVSGVAESRTRLKSLSSIWYWCFSFWLTSLCIIGSSFIHLIRTDSNVNYPHFSIHWWLLPSPLLLDPIMMAAKWDLSNSSFPSTLTSKLWAFYCKQRTSLLPNLFIYL